jgi:hypothetical protein
MCRSPGAIAFVAAILVTARASVAEESNASDVIGTRDTAFALAAGLGSAYDLLGFHLELSSPKAALFVGAGLPSVILRDSKPGGSHYDLAAGIRFFSGHRDGAFLSLQTMWSLAGDQPTDDRGTPLGDPTHLKSFGFTAGGRFRKKHLFFEAGAGLMLIQMAPDCEGCQSYRLFPDLSLGGGYQF